MATALENQFVHNYSKLLIQVWTDRGFLQRLQTNPVQTLKEYGIAVPANVKVNIVREAPQGHTPSLEAQVRAWDQAQSTKVFDLYIPQQPQLGQQTASAKGEFEVADTKYCCCCCPCCTCT